MTTEQNIKHTEERLARIIELVRAGGILNEQDESYLRNTIALLENHRTTENQKVMLELYLQASKLANAIKTIEEAQSALMSQTTKLQQLERNVQNLVNVIKQSEAAKQQAEAEQKVDEQPHFVGDIVVEEHPDGSHDGE